MKPNRSIYGMCLHLAVAILLAITIYLSVELARRKSYEQRMVNLIKPEIQNICEELEIDTELNDLEDLLEAFKEIATGI